MSNIGFIGLGIMGNPMALKRNSTSSSFLMLPL